MPAEDVGDRILGLTGDHVYITVGMVFLLTYDFM